MFSSPIRAGMSRVSLQPEDVSAIFFCSKNYRPLLRKARSTSSGRPGTSSFILPLPRTGSWSSIRPTRRKRSRTISISARRYSPDHIIWRYDPDLHNGQALLRAAPGPLHAPGRTAQGVMSTRCIISFAHPYKKALAEFQEIYRSPDGRALLEQKAGVCTGAGGQGSEVRHPSLCLLQRSPALGPGSQGKLHRRGLLSRLFKSPIDTRPARRGKNAAAPKARISAPTIPAPMAASTVMQMRTRTRRRQSEGTTRNGIRSR